MITKLCGELSLMTQVNHQNIVKCKGLCFLENEAMPVLLMERLKSNLHAYLLEPTNLNIALVVKLSILCDVASGLFYLHSHIPAIIHRDLTGKNVLLDTELRAKIADFGNARIMDLDPETTPETFTSMPGTREYMPPEAEGHSAKYDPSLDVFSFGHLSLFTIIQAPVHPLLPSTYTDPEGLLHARSEVKRRELYLDKAKKLLGGKHSLVVLVKKCLHNSPGQRPKTAELVTRLQDILGILGEVNGRTTLYLLPLSCYSSHSHPHLFPPFLHVFVPPLWLISLHLHPSLPCTVSASSPFQSTAQQLRKVQVIPGIYTFHQHKKRTGKAIRTKVAYS